jgi:hypothetical protein
MEYLQPPLEQNPSALLQTFNEAMEVAFPGWTPASGNLDARMAAAGAQIGAQLMEAAGDGATNYFRYFGANIVGLPPHEAKFANGTTTWVITDALGHTIPAGTVAVFLDGLGNRWGFETLEAAVVAPGSKEVTGVSVRSVLPGAGANGISGVAVEISGNPPTFVASITLVSPTSEGAEAESDGAYLSRLVEENSTLSPTPITPRDFNIILTNKSNVGRAFTLRGFNPTGTVVHSGGIAVSKEITGLTTVVTEQLVVGSAVTGTGIPASTFVTEVGAGTVKLNNATTKTETTSCTFTGVLKSAGYTASWVGSPTSEALSAEAMAQLETEIQEQCLAGVTFKVLAPTFTTINVAATVFAWPGQIAASIKEAIETAIKTYLSPERWGQPPTGQSKEWNNDPRVRIVNAEHAILQVIGTHYVASLELNAGTTDITMTGVVALPKLGTLTVNVNIG